MTRRRALTTGEAAEFCSVNFRTVIRWIERGMLKAFKLPGRGDHRILVQDFLLFLDEHGIPIPSELRSAGNRVLIVDDEPEMANAIRRSLAKAGFETEIAIGAFQAGALLGTFGPSVMTLDLMMPGMGGLDLLRFVRGNPALSRVRILVVSGLEQERLEEALAAGADDCLSKPYREDDLVKKLKMLAGVE